MTTTNKSRRTLLKSIAAGGGAVVAGKTLPDTWKKPVIDSVMLPAHARTSGDDFSGLYSTQTRLSPVPMEPGSDLRSRSPRDSADVCWAGWCRRPMLTTFSWQSATTSTTLFSRFRRAAVLGPCRSASTRHNPEPRPRPPSPANSLSNVTIPLLEDVGENCEANDEALVLTNITVGPNGVSGNLEAVEDGDEVACNDSFLAEPTAGSFSCSEACFGTI